MADGVPGRSPSPDGQNLKQPLNFDDQLKMISNRFRAYSLMLLLGLGWLGVLLLPASLAGRGMVEAALTLYRSFSLICHQIPARSWSLFGAPLGVCSRCTAIYVGGVVALAGYPLLEHWRGGDWVRERSRFWLTLAALPMALDVGFDWLGVFHNTFTTRAITGGLFGLFAIIHLAPLLLSLLLASGDDWRPGAPASKE